MKKEELLKAKTFDELLDIKYGKIGTPARDKHEEEANYFVICEMVREAGKEAKNHPGRIG